MNSITEVPLLVVLVRDTVHLDNGRALIVLRGSLWDPATAMAKEKFGLIVPMTLSPRSSVSFYHDKNPGKNDIL